MWQVWQATDFTWVSTRASVCLCPAWQSVQATPFESSTPTEKARPLIWWSGALWQSTQRKP